MSIGRISELASQYLILKTQKTTVIEMEMIKQVLLHTAQTRGPKFRSQECIQAAWHGYACADAVEVEAEKLKKRLAADSALVSVRPLSKGSKAGRDEDS